MSFVIADMRLAYLSSLLATEFQCRYKPNLVLLMAHLTENLLALPVVAEFHFYCSSLSLVQCASKSLIIDSKITSTGAQSRFSIFSSLAK